MAESNTNDKKRHLDANELQRLSELLAFKVARDDFRPTFLVALWRGGCAPGAIVQEFLERAQSTKIDHVAVRTASRDVDGKPFPATQVHAVGHLLKSLTRVSRLLIVDDVFDSGRSIQAILEHLKTELGDRMPEHIRVASVFYKPLKHKYGPKPAYYVEETDEWLVFPHELVELTNDEIKQHRPHVYGLLNKLMEMEGVW
jgi:hypoxanthine phosphoribosyltransferase